MLVFDNDPPYKRKQLHKNAVTRHTHLNSRVENSLALVDMDGRKCAESIGFIEE